MTNVRQPIHQLSELHNKTRVFRDRADAGQRLSGMLADYCDASTRVVAIPAGGVPVAAEVARHLGLPLEIAVVSKVLLPWTTEAGYGAVAFDNSVWISEDAAMRFGLSQRDIEKGVEEAKAKVQRRIGRFGTQTPFPRLANHSIIVVDDGLAAGSTMRAAVAALKTRGAERIVVAVPTGHRRSVGTIAYEVDAVYCANVRGGASFAVAEAYANWSDVTEDEVAEILSSFPETRPRVT